MGRTYVVKMGNRGRLVVPVELRERAGLTAGAPLILVESESGLVILTREQAREHLRRQLEGHNLVEELLTERRQATGLADDVA